MKKSLLLSALTLAATVSFAQTAVKSTLSRQDVGTTKARSTQVASQKMQNYNPLPVRDVKKEIMTTSSKKNGPRRLMSDGIFYSKPVGTLYGGWDMMDGGRGYYFTTLVAPAFTDLTFENKTEGKSLWSVNGQSADESSIVDGNYTDNYYRSEESQGLALYYAPTVETRAGEYTLGEYNYLLKRGYTEVKGIVRIDSMTCLSPADPRTATYSENDKTYYGPYALWGALDNDNLFGQGSLDGGWGNSTYTVQVFDKPITPLYITQILVDACTNSQPIAEGAQLKAHITKTKVVTKTYQSGETEDFITADMDNILATFYAGAADTLDFVTTTTRNQKTINTGYIIFNKPGYEDILGNVVPGSLVIDEEFAVVIDGLNEEGIDVGFYGIETEDGDDQVRRAQQWFEVNNFITYTSNISLAVSLYGMFDRAVAPKNPNWYTFEDEALDYTVVRVPVEGSEPYAEQYGYGNYTDGSEGSPFVEGSTEGYTGYSGVPVFTSVSWFDEDENQNYDIINLPDWITSVSIDPSFGYGLNQVMFYAEPLPEGVSGRKAVVYVVGQMEIGEDENIAEADRKYSTVSEAITIVQGEVGDVEEETVPFDFTAKVGVAAADWVGASGLCATQFAPAVITADGRSAQLAEKYETTVETVGDIMTQTIEGLENGKYTVTLVANAFFTNDRGFDSNMEDGATDVAYVYANDQKAPLTAHIATATSENGEFTLNVEVTDGTLKLGFAKDQAGTNWHTIQIKALTQQVPLSQAWAALAAEAQSLLDQDMEATALEALKAALDAEKSVDNYNALAAAVAAAKASINAYANAANVLTAMKALVDATNVYTQEAYDEYYGTPAAKYEAKTLTAAEGAALQNPEIVTGWHAAITVDNFLLSAWDTNPNFVDAPYYINTWSVEGDTDGSNFRVPFFEYWTGDGDSLGERTLTATMTGLENGEYEVTSWTRVRTKNNTGAYTSGEGIFLQVNDGNAVDAAKGDSKYELGADNNFFVGNVAAKGNVTDGTLNIKYIVAAENNVSWLSFKNVFFKRIGDVNGINTVNAAAEQNNQMFNLQGQKVEKAGKGLYIINGKKVVK